MMRARLAATLLLVLTAGCASVDPRPSFDAVATTVRDRTGLEPTWSQDEEAEDAAEDLVRQLLVKPLDDRSAARIALLRNRSLLAEIEELGIARADYAQATRIANPTLSVLRRTPDSGTGTNVEIEIVENLLDVLVQPARKRLAAVELEAAKLHLGQSMLDLVAETRISYFDFVAAREKVEKLSLVGELASAAARLALSQRDAGNLGERDVAMFEAEHAQASIELIRAQLAAGHARDRLDVLLGLSGESTDWEAQQGLPPLPGTEQDLGALESRAIERRLDLAAARFGVDLVGRALALKKGTRYFPIGIDLGIDREKETDGIRLQGPSISIALPVFDTGAASIARLEAEQRRAQRLLEGMAIEIRSEARLFRDQVLGARALVETYQRVLLPKRRIVLEQTLLHYNMMLLGVYDLLLARRNETEAQQEATEALHDYWVARVRLERALGGDAHWDDPGASPHTMPQAPAAAPAMEHPHDHGSSAPGGES